MFRNILTSLILLVVIFPVVLFAQDDNYLEQRVERIYDRIIKDSSENISEEEKSFLKEEIRQKLSGEYEGLDLSGLTPGSVQTISPQIDDVVDCFDYYTFGSLRVSLSPNFEITTTGTKVSFEGSITNENPYPIVDGSVFVKIFKQYTDRRQASNTEPVIDQFFAIENISLDAGETREYSFDWQVPQYAETGTYRLSTYFVTDHRFNLSGLSFTDDVVGDSVFFGIESTQNNVLKFDKNKTLLNGNPYLFASFPPRFPEDGLVTARFFIENETNNTIRVPVKIELYEWDSLQQQNFVREKNQVIQVPPQGTYVDFPVSDSVHAVYYIVAQMNYRDLNSVIGVRFVREGIDETRINFPSVMKFPLRAGQDNTLFACLHNTGTSGVVENNRLEMELIDTDTGKLVHSYSYEGPITNAMMGVKEDFVPKRSVDNMTLVANLYQDDKLVDRANIEYRCEDINPDSCGALNKTVWIIIGILAGLAVVISFMWFVRKRRNQDLI